MRAARCISASTLLIMISAMLKGTRIPSPSIFKSPSSREWRAIFDNVLTHITPCCNQRSCVTLLFRAEAKNALGRQLLRELQECINTLRQERTTRCVIIRSLVPGTFCVGADLKVGGPGAKVAPPAVASWLSYCVTFMLLQIVKQALILLADHIITVFSANCT